MSPRKRANQLVERANATEDDAEAEALLHEAMREDPTWSVPPYNLGLLCKYQRRWDESRALNRRAAELDGDDEAAWWNLGIAATALGDWPTARDAWSHCGIELPPGEGPPHRDWGLVPVRLDPAGEGEVVWADRIDPARAIVRSVPLPWSSFAWGDVVLHDGAAEGYRVRNGERYPVFNVLERLVPSSLSTFIVELGSVSQAAIDALWEVATEAGGSAEYWGATTRVLCRDCSLGTPHEHTDDGHAPAHPHCGLAATDEAHADAILKRWLEETTGADLVRWYSATDPH